MQARDFGTSGLRDFGTSGLRDFGTFPTEAASRWSFLTLQVPGAKILSDALKAMGVGALGCPDAPFMPHSCPAFFDCHAAECHAAESTSGVFVPDKLEPPAQST